MKIKNPDYKQTILDEFKAQKFMAFINARVTKIEPGHCEIEVSYKEDLSQHHGYLHAGITGTLADNASGFAAYTVIEKGSSIVTSEYKINFLSPVVGEKIIARGNVVKAGKTLIVCRSDVYDVKSGVEKLCATALLTMVEIKGK
jgi:uncharacterized protein (TIGR00369 family)